MLVDFERVIALLKREVASKPSHGQRDLLATIARLEGECMIEEGLPEKALRLYGPDLADALAQLRPARRDPRVVLADGLADDAGGVTTDRRTNGSSHAVRG
jgi:hypothetical protein